VKFYPENECSALPLSGNVFISVKNKDKRAIIFIAKKLADLGFRIYATKGTGSVLQKSGLEITTVRKVMEGRPNIVDHINNGEIDLIINTPAGKGPRSDDFEIRRAAINHNILIRSLTLANSFRWWYPFSGYDVPPLVMRDLRRLIIFAKGYFMSLLS